MSKFCPVEHASSICLNLKLAIEAAASAGLVVAEGAEKVHTIEQKGVGDLVSDIDREADRKACAILNEGSDLPILSEELNADQQISGDMWIVDPLDGTSAYLMKAGPMYSSTIIALRQNGETQIGVLFVPLMDDWYYAVKGKGAWKNGEPLRCGESDESLNQVWVEMNHFGDSAYESDFFKHLRTKLRTAGGPKLVTHSPPHSVVAMRIADSNSPLGIAIHDNHTDSVKQCPWDIAAPQLILEEAGGVYLTPEGKRTDPFQPDPIVVARSQKLADQLFEFCKI